MPEHNNSGSGSPVVLDRLSHHFGRTVALSAVSLTVPKGGVFGLVGENGAYLDAAGPFAGVAILCYAYASGHRAHHRQA